VAAFGLGVVSPKFRARDPGIHQHYRPGTSPVICLCTRKRNHSMETKGEKAAA